MTSMKKITAIFLFMTFSSFAQESYLNFEQSLRSQAYIVKKGDTLAQILNDHGFTGVYKNTDQNRHLNPVKLVMWKNGLKEEDLKHLEPGQVIYLPHMDQVNRGVASVSESQTDPDVEDIPFKEVKRDVEEYASEENSFF